MRKYVVKAYTNISETDINLSNATDKSCVPTDDNGTYGMLEFCEDQLSRDNFKSNRWYSSAEALNIISKSDWVEYAV